MSVTSKLSCGNDCTPVVQFPKLMKGRTSGVIVFFDKERCGMCVFEGDSNCGSKVGRYSSGWSMAYFDDMPIAEGVTLQNAQP